MFDFLGMRGNYDTRKVARFDEGELLVSTARVTDGSKPFETAVEHPDYNEGKMVIVEAYDDKDSAQSGHDRWVQTMTTTPLPQMLTDCCNSEIGEFARAMDCDREFPRVTAQDEQ